MAVSLASQGLTFRIMGSITVPSLLIDIRSIFKGLGPEEVTDGYIDKAAAPLLAGHAGAI